MSFSVTFGSHPGGRRWDHHPHHHRGHCRPIGLPVVVTSARPWYKPVFVSSPWAPRPWAPRPAPTVFVKPVPRIHVVDKVSSAIGGLALSSLFGITGVAFTALGILALDPPAIVFGVVCLTISAAIGIPSGHVLIKG